MENMSSIELTFLVVAAIVVCLALWSSRDKIKSKLSGGSSGRKGASQDKR